MGTLSDTNAQNLGIYLPGSTGTLSERNMIDLGIYAATLSNVQTPPGQGTLSDVNAKRFGVQPASLVGGTHLNDGDPVSLWPDSTGNGHNATASGSARPTFKWNIVGGKPVVRFTSAGQSGMQLAIPLPATEPFEFYAVMKPASPTSILFSLTSTTDPGPLGVGQNPPGLSNYLLFESAANIVYGTPDTASSAFCVVTGSILGGSGGIAVNGVNISVTVGAAADPGNFTHMGYRPTSLVYSDGDLAEVIMFPAPQTTPNWDGIIQFLSNKYGLGLSVGTPVDPATLSPLAQWKADALL